MEWGSDEAMTADVTRTFQPVPAVLEFKRYGFRNFQTSDALSTGWKPVSRGEVQAMKRDIDEQNLTAYALGESQTSSARAVVEASLAGEPAARGRVEQIRAAARVLADALA